MNNEKLGNKEATCLIIMLIVNNIVFSAQKILLNSSSSLLNSIYISLIAIGITFIVCLLFKKFSSYDILDISKFLGGKFLYYTVGILFFVYFLFTSAILLRKIADSLQIIYYSVTSVVFIIIPFLIASSIAANFGENGISRAGLIITPIAIATIILIFFGNIKIFDYSNIYPILGNGIKDTFFYGISNLFAFYGLTYIFFLPPTLKEPQNFRKITLTACIISGIFLIFSIANIVFLFNNGISNDTVFPLYIAVRYIEFGLFFQRLDSFFLLIWILSFSYFLGIMIKILANITKKLINLEDDKTPILPIALGIFGTSIIPFNSSALNFIQDNILKIAFFAILGISFIILILANLKTR